MPSGTGSMAFFSPHLALAQVQPPLTINAPNRPTSAWISNSARRRHTGGSSATMDSSPMWPASRTPTARPKAVTNSTSSMASASAQVGVSFIT